MTSVRSVGRRLARVARGRSARSSSWALVGQLSSVVASAANFLLLARLLGPSEYGLVAGTWALVMAASPLASLGSERLIIRDVSAGALPPPRALGAGLLTLTAGALLVMGALFGLRGVLLPQTPLLLLGSLAVAEVLASRAVALVSSLCFAVDNARAAAVSAIFVTLSKLLAVGTFAALGGNDAVIWAGLYAAFSLVSAAGQLGWAIRRFGWPSASGYRPIRRAREGLPYTGNVMATVIQNDADKTLLVRYGLTEEAGLYNVAYRLVSMAFVPVLAVLQVMLPRYFAVGGASGLPATTALARRLVMPLLGYAALVTLMLVAFAPLLPVLLGEEYEDSTVLLALLAPLLLFKVLQTVLGDGLTGAEMQTTRTVCVAIAAATNVALNIFLIPRIGLAGSLVATYVAELMQVLLVVAAIRIGLGRSRRAEVTEQGHQAAKPAGG